MTLTEHLLECLGEEGSEVAQATSKCNRFGLTDRNVLNPTGPTNSERLVEELNDLMAVIEMCVDHDIVPHDWLSDDAIRAKKEKVIKFIDYAREKGRLAHELRAPRSEFRAQIGGG